MAEDWERNWQEGDAPLPQKQRKGGDPVISQMFLQFSQWPLLSPEEEKALLNLYFLSRRHLEPLSEHLGLTPEETRLGIRATALHLLGLGEGKGGFTEGDFPKELRLNYAQVLEGEKARTRLIMSNARLVVSLAKKYQQRWPQIPLEDMIQEGFIGLLRAIDGFDPRKGNKLSTYATWWIRDALNKAVRKNLFSHKDPFDREGGLVLVHSLDDVVGEDGDRFADLLQDEKGVNPPSLLEEKFLQEKMEEIFRRMDLREVYVLGHLYGLMGFPQRDYTYLAQKLGLSVARVRQIEARAKENVLQEMERMGLSSWGTIVLLNRDGLLDGGEKDWDEEERGTDKGA